MYCTPSVFNWAFELWLSSVQSFVWRGYPFGLRWLHLKKLFSAGIKVDGDLELSLILAKGEAEHYKKANRSESAVLEQKRASIHKSNSRWLMSHMKLFWNTPVPQSDITRLWRDLLSLAELEAEVAENFSDWESYRNESSSGSTHCDHQNSIEKEKRKVQGYCWKQKNAFLKTSYLTSITLMRKIPCFLWDSSYFLKYWRLSIASHNGSKHRHISAE